MDVDAVEQVLKEHGCTITPQRRAVLRFLDGNLDHPSAARIYEAVTADGAVSQGFSDNGFKKRFGVGA